MGRKRRQFSREFKVEAVRQALTTKGSLAALARELGVRPDMLRTCKRRVEAQGGATGRDVFPGQGQLTSQDEELRQLRRRVAVLEEERDILKKATVFFARDAR
jgi:transposase